jgi:hypothetical protein
MTTKEELQKQIDELKAKLLDLTDVIERISEEDEPKEYWYLTFTIPRLSRADYNTTTLTAQKPQDLFRLFQATSTEGDTHGLGRYKTKEYAEMARACIINLLHLLKINEDRNDPRVDVSLYEVSARAGKEIIKRMEDGTYE